jgi:hypothetical protein
MEPIPLPGSSHSWLVARHPDGHREHLPDLLPPFLARLEAEGRDAVDDTDLSALSDEAAAEFRALDIRSAATWGRSSEGSHAYLVEVDSYWLGA